VHTVVVAAAMAMEWLLLGVAGLLVYAVAVPWSDMPRAINLVALLLAGPWRRWPCTRVCSGRCSTGWRLASAWRRPCRAPAADLVAWCAREALVLALAGAGLYLVMRGIGPVADLADAMAVTGLTLALANLLAWLPASAVLKDASMAVLLTPLYGTLGLALVVVVVWRLWLTAVQLSWAGLALVVLRRGPKVELPPMDPRALTAPERPRPRLLPLVHVLS